MRVAIDGYELKSAFTGVGRFVNNLVGELARQYASAEFVVFQPQTATTCPRADNISRVLLPERNNFTIWQQVTLNRALRRGGWDLFFSPNHSLPLGLKSRTVMTVHDLSWRAVPRDFSLKERIGRDLRTRLSLRRADAIVTDCRFTAEELSRYYDVAGAGVTVIPLAVEDGFTRASREEINDFRRRYGLGAEPLLGYLGTMLGRRHVPNMVAACQLLRGEMPVRLFLVGADPEGIMKRGPGPENGVHWCVRLAEKDLNAFYSSLDLLLCLSDYEGFGFPVLEAMACGTPSLLAATSSLRELFQELAIFVAVPQPEIVAAALRSFFLRQESVRQQLFAAWRLKKEFFSWSRVASEYRRVFSRLGE